MEASKVFINKAGRLRSGWRCGVFILAFIALWFLCTSVLRVAYAIAFNLHLIPSELVQDFSFRLMMIVTAFGAGWICSRWLEGLPWHALGLWFHEHWFRDLLVGSAVGGGSLVIAALVALAGGGVSFTLSVGDVVLPLARELAAWAMLFIIAALAEEAVFRGYPLQTLTRAGLAWLAVVLTSVPFAAGHLANPNVAAGFTFANTALAGVWLALAYLKTRSLWFPLGVHWCWNWVQGSIFGSPVSGLVLTKHPLFHEVDKGPAWLTGGSYGLEGGLACTVALLISIMFIWRTRLVSATPEMKKLTSEENPAKLRVEYQLFPQAERGPTDL